MSDAVSLGSVNVDRTWYLPAERICDLENRCGWFPATGETVRIEGSPDLPAGVLEGARYRTAVGGKGSKQTVAAARAGADAAFLGCVGRDEAEYDVRETLAERGVAVDGVTTSDRETGKASVFVDEGGESRIAIVGGANDAVDSQYVDRSLERLRAVNAVLLQNEIPVSATETALERLETDENASERPTVVLNPAPADGAEPLVDCAAVDVIVVNEGKYVALEDRLADADATVVRTRGHDDVLVTDAGAVTDLRVTPPTVDAVDATGAGDTFCGYLATLLAEGEDLERAVEVATVAGSLATETEGVQIVIPERGTVERALEDAFGAVGDER
ncbi:PfkB family carbohydrate kinase [Haloterrigena salifodinae]|uniref:PfkB family carbohydrate kinase n=1 Tax=Haloterrigena salifodinae TaxID=2675099 RepID=UPI000F8845A7|nr:PfkB family carbohydrate kinase [Haloterrigena salifodinae]